MSTTTKTLNMIRDEVYIFAKESGHDGMYSESEVIPYMLIDRLDRIILLLEAQNPLSNVKLATRVIPNEPPTD